MPHHFRPVDDVSFDLYFQITLITSRGGTISAFSPTGRPSDAFIETMVAHYKSHPAVLGYNLIDEPFAELYPMLKETSDRIKALDPGKLIYTNHYGLNEKSSHYYALDGTPPMGYEEYYKLWLDTNPDMFSFDYYPFKREGFDEHVYFQTLEYFREQSLVTGIDFWAYIQSVAYDYFGILEPNEHQIRFQVYSTLAYGAKGYVYWTYCTPSIVIDDKEWCHNGIILRDGSKNKTYDYARRINGEVLKLGTVLLSLVSEDVYFTGDLPSWTRTLPADYFWQPAGETRKLPMIVSGFRDEDGGLFVMIVNRDLERGHTFTFALSGGWETVSEICKSTGAPTATDYNRAAGTLSFHLAPGDARLFALTP